MITLSASAYDNQKFDRSSFDKSTFNINADTKFLWNNRIFIDSSHEFLWNNRVFTDSSHKFLWNNRVFTDSGHKFLWNNRVFIDSSHKFLWNNRVFTVEEPIIFLWNNRVFIDDSTKFLWNGIAFSQASVKFLWDSVSYSTASLKCLWSNVAYSSENVKFLWDNTSYSTASLKCLWDNVSYTSSGHKFLWNNRIYTDRVSVQSTFDHQRFDKSSFDRGSEFVDAEFTIRWDNKVFSAATTKLLWDNVSYAGSSHKFLWNNRVFTDSSHKFLWNNAIYSQANTKFLWDSTSFAHADAKFLWNNRVFTDSDIIFLWGSGYTEGETKFLWNSKAYVSGDTKFLWNNRNFTDSSTIFKWSMMAYTAAATIKFLWSEAPTISSLVLAACGLFSEENAILGSLDYPVDYLSVKTLQDEYIYPEILDGEISLKDGSIAEATFKLNEFVPENSRCTFYLKGSTRLFDGISRRCFKDSSGIYNLTVQEYSEILQPENGKGGLYLAKYEWHDVELHNLVSSNKPTDNDSTVGILYIACSAIPWFFFVESDTTNHIFKWEYEGIAYTITEMFEDEVLLTARASAVALQSASGWYHDAVNKILYVRCTDDVSPYYHIISVPYIWDFKVPIRIGNVRDQASTVLTYWETANGDVPYTTLDTLLTALDLEKEAVYRNGYCYIDISSRIGSGSTSSPANYYSEEENIVKIEQIDMADARNQVSGAMITAYGGGASAVKAGKHRNMGYGGRFILLDDSTIHNTVVAEGFVQKYLDDHYLPARSIKFTAPVDLGKVVDHRRIGDAAHISIPSEHIEQDLRAKEVLIKLKPLEQLLTFGDRLISYEDQIKAMKDAAEKYRRHLQGEIEEFSDSWSENLDNKANKSHKFTIKADTLKVQKLELLCSTDLYRMDANNSSGGGGGGGGAGGEEPSEKTNITITFNPHHHSLLSGLTGNPSESDYVASKGHTHTFSTTTGTPSSTATIATSNHAHTFTATTGTPSATATIATSNHAHTFTATTGTPSATATIATSGHTHTFSATTGTPSKIVAVSLSTHTHTFSATTAATASAALSVPAYAHTHPFSATTAATADGAVAAAITALGSPATACCTAVGCGKRFVTGYSPTHTNVAAYAHTHAVSGTATATASVVLSVSAYAHTHTVSGTTAATGGAFVGSAASSSHTHSVAGTTAATATTTTAASSTHTHTVAGTTSIGALTITVASNAHTHSVSGTTDANTSTTTVASNAHTHSVSGTTDATNSTIDVALGAHTHTLINLQTDDGVVTATITNDTGWIPYLAMQDNSEVQVDPTTKEPYDDWNSSTGHLQDTSDPYTCFLTSGTPHSPGADPEMYLTIKLSGPGITGSQEITGSPFVINVKDSIGPVLIDDLIKKEGEFTVTVSLENKDYPADKARIHFTIQIQGQIFVDTIVKA